MIRGNQGRSRAIRGDQGRSGAIRDNEGQSGAIRGNHLPAPMKAPNSILSTMTPTGSLYEL